MTPKVLVVEDTLSIRELLKELLESESYSVVTADHGASGLAALEKYGDKIKTIILDLEMPVMDGHKFIAKLKEMVNPPPVIITSANPYTFYREYINLPKPYDVKVLLDHLRRLTHT